MNFRNIKHIQDEINEKHDFIQELYLKISETEEEISELYYDMSRDDMGELACCCKCSQFFIDCGCLIFDDGGIHEYMNDIRIVTKTDRIEVEYV